MAKTHSPRRSASVEADAPSLESQPGPLDGCWRQALPKQTSWVTRCLCRALVAHLRPKLLGLSGVEHLLSLPDPFIVVANHNQRHEAVLLPALLTYLRQGQLIHFLADWPMALVPGVAWLYRRGGVILVGRKPAKVSWLNRLRPWLVDRRPAVDRAFEALASGKSVGIFPEGTLNRDPTRLLRGLEGAARLAATARVSVLPIGLRFPRHGDASPIADGEAMEIAIGKALFPPVASTDSPTSDVIATFHQQIMQELARLSGKSWQADAPRRKFHAPATHRRSS